MRIPMLTLAMLDFRNLVRGILPKKTVRYTVFGALTFFSILLSIVVVALTLTDKSASDNFTNINRITGLLLGMLGMALAGVTLVSAQDIENPSQIKIALLSPWLETYQIIPRIISLIIVSILPFSVFIFPFLLAFLIKNFLSGFYIILIVCISLIFSVSLGILAISIIVKFLGKSKGSQMATVASLTIGFTIQMSIAKLISLKIPLDHASIILVSCTLITPIIAFLSLKTYRNTLLNSRENLISKEPNWEIYPWSQFFWRGKSIWIMGAFSMSTFITFFITENGKDLIWKNLAIVFGNVLSYVINELIEFDRDRLILWKIAPNRSGVMKQLFISKFLPLFLTSIATIFVIGFMFHKLNWAIATACLVLLQIGILNLQYGKFITIILTGIGLILIFASPLFS